MKIKNRLSAIALEWRLALGKKLVSSYSKKMKSVQDFIKERQKVLCRHINGTYTQHIPITADENKELLKQLHVQSSRQSIFVHEIFRIWVALLST